MSEWQPIETAPKDEKVLVVFLEPFFGKFTQETESAYYDSGSGKWLFWLYGREIVGGGVTHWMPLPEPPETDK